MGRIIKALLICSVLIFNIGTVLGSDFQDYTEDAALINLAPQQFKTLETMEKRLYGKTYRDENTLYRIEKLESALLNEEPKKSSKNISARINKLKLASQRQALSGTSIPSSMSKHFMQRDIQNEDVSGNDGVGIIDGLLKVWRPDLYDQLEYFRRLKKESRPPRYFY